MNVSNVNTQSNIHPAFQLRRYAWSVKFSLAILTDFEECTVYDCRIRPDKGDKASTGGKKEMLQLETAVTDRQIDALVYELYGLTEEEISIVEG